MLSLAFLVCTLSIPAVDPKADDAAPVAEPLKPLSQETKTAFKVQVKAKSSKASPLRFSVTGLRKDGKEVAVPPNMRLASDKGAFSWTPTPSQAGVYDLTLSVKDAKDRSASVNVRLTVRARAITSASGPVGDLLRKWYAEGTAAGNTGDFYDNRDRDHSPLNLASYPQLDQVIYTDEQRKRNLDWAAQGTLHDQVTFGNSSTSAPVLYGGSNPRHYYTHPRGMSFLYQQYRKNNLYIYPAHHDHHPGHNGKPFYGDVYPANCPYLIVSQGSSGSDQPFMRAVPFTLAAFRPEVKAKLIASGLLMPTLQMIFRSSNKQLKTPEEYLTGKAHPPVFEGAWVDDLKMVQAAQAIRLNNIPPMIQLKVVKEDEAVEGRDYFEPGKMEKLHDTPAAICRVVRGLGHTRRMVVSAGDSFDLNKKPLKFHWAVLRGDPKRIAIKPLNAAGSVAEIRVAYHERRKVNPASPMESNRVDVGAFVHNGAYYSAPGFVSFFSLDNEARTYDANGRLLEIGYGAGEAEMTVSDWNAVFEQLQGKSDGLGSQLLIKQLRAKDLGGLRKVGEEYRVAFAKRQAAEEKHKLAAEAKNKADAAFVKAADKKSADATRKQAEADLRDAQRELDTARRAAEDLLRTKRSGLEEPAGTIWERALNGLKENPGFAIDNREAIETLAKNADAGHRARYQAARKRLIAMGIAKEQDGIHQLQPLRQGKEPVAERLTRYERMLVEWYNAEILASLVYPRGVSSSFKVNFVDQRISTPKHWRDVYRRDSKGDVVGWTRYAEAGATEFNAEGLMIVEKDAQGRALKARKVKYEYQGKDFFSRTIKWAPTGEVVRYQYKDE
jgi:hypothetical protein